MTGTTLRADGRVDRPAHFPILSKEITLPLSSRELATVIAALRYWRDEMVPHAPDLMSPYFEGLRGPPLSMGELQKLLDRLVQEAGPHPTD